MTPTDLIAAHRHTTGYTLGAITAAYLLNSGWTLATYRAIRLLALHALDMQPLTCPQALSRNEADYGTQERPQQVADHYCVRAEVCAHAGLSVEFAIAWLVALASDHNHADTEWLNAALRDSDPALLALWQHVGPLAPLMVAAGVTRQEAQEAPPGSDLLDPSRLRALAALRGYRFPVCTADTAQPLTAAGCPDILLTIRP